MPPELVNLLITLLFSLILLLMFFWLIRALIPSAREKAKQYMRDKFDLAGYESISAIRRKEYAVISLGFFVIILCLAIMGWLIYLITSAGFDAAFEQQRGINLVLIYIPTVILLVIIVKASSMYIKIQHEVLREFNKFRAARAKTIAEHEARRAGKGEKREEESAEKRRRP